MTAFSIDKIEKICYNIINTINQKENFMKEFTFIEQMEENVKYNLTFPYHIDFDKLLGNQYYNKDYGNAFHCHSFEYILMKVYHEPKAFYLTEDDKKYYSEQEIVFIEKVKEDETRKIDSGMELITLDLNTETINYINAYKSLVYGADNDLVFNPTLYEIWFDVDGVLYHISPGETIELKRQL